MAHLVGEPVRAKCNLQAWLVGIALRVDILAGRTQRLSAVCIGRGNTLCGSCARGGDVHETTSTESAFHSPDG